MAVKYNLILLPGLDGTGELFAPLIEHLPESVNPMIFSYPRKQPKTYEELRAIILRKLPGDRPYFILGESFSGPLSLMVACERPEGLVGLILCATFIRNPFILLRDWMGFLSISPVYRLWPLFIRVRAAGRKKKIGEIADLALKAIRTVDPSVIAHRVKSIFSVDVENDLRSCPCPILYIMAGRDSLIRRHNYERIKTIRGDIRLAVIDTLHFVLQLEPKKASEILVEFMDNTMKEADEIK